MVRFVLIAALVLSACATLPARFSNVPPETVIHDNQRFEVREVQQASNPAHYELAVVWIPHGEFRIEPSFLEQTIKQVGQAYMARKCANPNLYAVKDPELERRPGTLEHGLYLSFKCA